MPLGALDQLPGLQPAAHDALHIRQQRALDDLRGTVAGLQDAVATLQEAATSLGVHPDNSDDVLWSTKPLFVSYTLQQLGASST